jgi:6-phosphogluconolactonase
MTRSAWLSRRRFAKMTMMTALASRMPLLSEVINPIRRMGEGSPRFAYVGVMQETPGIHVYAVEGKHWNQRQFIASEAPASLALHQGRHTLYVANEVSEYRGLPCGTVEAFSIAADTGRLTSLGRQSLSLSATMPRHIAVAPDGQSLVVASHGGGIYNQLSILPDGQLGRVFGVIKETGCGPIHDHQESAHPQAISFDLAGNRFIATDLGSDRITVFSTEAGLSAHARYDMPPGSGPCHLAMHPNGNLLYVSHSLDSSVSGLRYDANAARVTERLIWVHEGAGEAMAMHPSGDFLYTAGKGQVTAWQINGLTGAFYSVQSRGIEREEAVCEMCVQPQGHELVVLTGEGIQCMAIDPATGGLGAPVAVASAAGARSVAIL